MLCMPRLYLYGFMPFVDDGMLACFDIEDRAAILSDDEQTEIAKVTSQGTWAPRIVNKGLGPPMKGVLALNANFFSGDTSECI